MLTHDFRTLIATLTGLLLFGNYPAESFDRALNAGRHIVAGCHGDRGGTGRRGQSGRDLARVRLPRLGSRAPQGHRHADRSLDTRRRHRRRGPAPPRARESRSSVWMQRRSGSSLPISSSPRISARSARSPKARSIGWRPSCRCPPPCSRYPGAPWRASGRTSVPWRGRSISPPTEMSWWRGSGAVSHGSGPAHGPQRTRTLVVEWLEPLYLAGHWVPEMVAAAGGEDVGAGPAVTPRGGIGPSWRSFARR